MMQRLIAVMLPARTDLPFARDDANRFLPWIIAFMVCLTGLFLGAGITLDRAINVDTRHYSHNMTVHLPYRQEGMDALTQQALDILRRKKGIASAEAIVENNVKTLLAPWFGSGDVLDLLPLPRLIEVTLEESDDHAPPALKAQDVKQALSSLPGEIQVDDNQLWVEQFSRFTSMVKMVAFSFASLIIATTLAIVVLSAMTTLKLHHKTVTLLHAFGATDRYIARQFQRNAFLLALRGALPGALVAGILFVGFDMTSSALKSSLLPSFSFTLLHAAMLAALPIATSLLSLCSARLTALAMLRRLH